MLPNYRSTREGDRVYGKTKEWEEEKDSAKYLNSPDTILFDKSRTLYGYHKAKAAIPKWKFTLLVEGQMDLLMCHQAGLVNIRWRHREQRLPRRS